nr:pyrophosphate-energized membrane proton pump 2 [Quercus suber]
MQVLNGSNNVDCTAPIDPPSFKIQRPSSGGDLPQFRRVYSNTLTMFVDNDVEGGNLGPYADRPRVFPSMRSKVHTPLIFWILMGINVRVLLILLLLGLGAIFYVGAKTSPIIVFVFSICIISFLFSIYLTKWVLTKDEGPSERVQINTTSHGLLNGDTIVISFVYCKRKPVSMLGCTNIQSPIVHTICGVRALSAITSEC